MLGFAPLAAIPLGSVQSFTATLEQMSATGAITFAGTGNIGAVRRMSASGGLTFSGSPFITVQVLSSASGSIAFGGSPNLRVAGRPIIITALYDNFTVRAMPEEWEVTALPQSFTVRGVPE